MQILFAPECDQRKSTLRRPRSIDALPRAALEVRSVPDVCRQTDRFGIGFKKGAVTDAGVPRTGRKGQPPAQFHFAFVRDPQLGRNGRFFREFNKWIVNNRGLFLRVDLQCKGLRNKSAFWCFDCANVALSRRSRRCSSQHCRQKESFEQNVPLKFSEFHTLPVMHYSVTTSGRKEAFLTREARKRRYRAGRQS